MLKLTKSVVVQEGKQTHCYLVFNHYGHSLETINALAKVAKTDFPALTDADIFFRTCRNTGYIDGIMGCEFAVPKDCVVSFSYVQSSKLPSY